jgi:fructosamine-3-kinase
MTLQSRVRALLHTDITGEEPLAGGCVGDVRKLQLADGRTVVAKVGTGAAPGLAHEAFMLEYLAENTRLPAPRVICADDHLLLMEYIPTSGRLNAAAQRDAAEHLAKLHAVTAPLFGFACDTLIGGLPQPNAQNPSWLTFFRDQRLLHRGRDAMTVGCLPADIFARLEMLCAHLDRWLTEPAAPSLIHGDMWGGNILCRDGKIAGFVDPALYYADPEIELAFSTLFGTFNDHFFAHYRAIRPLQPGFEDRAAIYNLYPLLVHVRLFGGSYVASIDQTLRRFGY